MHSAPPMNNAHYSTDSVNVKQRFEYWNDVVLRHCIPADSKLTSAIDFRGNLDVHSLGAIDVCTLSAVEHFWERKQKHLRHAPDNDIWIGFFEGGFGQLEQGGRTAEFTAGDLVLYDAAQTFRYTLGGEQNHLIRIPRHLLDRHLPRIETLTARVLDARKPGVIPLREMLRQAASCPESLQAGELAGRFSQTILDLLVLSLEVQNTNREHLEQDLYARIMNYIQRHLADRTLSLKTIAEAHHVSTRTVTRAFARHNKTAMAVVWQERLQASRDAILRGRVQSISQVALDLGFSDFSHFSHAFRKAFGDSPNSLLRGRTTYRDEESQ